MSNFIELVKQFAGATGLTDTRLDENGLCRIVIDDSTTVDFELNPKHGTLLLIGHVIPSVYEAGDNILADCLIRNAQIASNKGSFLAYDEAEDEFLLLRTLDNKAMHSGKFQTILNEFVGYIDHCREVLLTGDDGDEDDDADVARQAPPPMAANTEMLMFKI